MEYLIAPIDDNKVCGGCDQEKESVKAVTQIKRDYSKLDGMRNPLLVAVKTFLICEDCSNKPMFID